MTSTKGYTVQAPDDIIEPKEGRRVAWRHSDGTTLTGTITGHFGARLWHVEDDNGTAHVVGSWIMRDTEAE